MPKLLHVLPLLAGAALVACNQVPGLVAGPSPTTWLPLVEGGSWTYNVLTGTDVLGQITVTHSLVTTKDGVTTAHLRANGSNPFGDAKNPTQFDADFRAGSSDLSLVDAKGKTLFSFPLPLTIGKTWTVDAATVKVARNEDVSVPAQAYRGALVIEGENKDVVTTIWMAENVGVVKLQIAPKSGAATLRGELKSFTKP